MNKYFDWIIRMIGYALVLITVSIIFNDTIYIDNTYYGIWGLIAVIIIFIALYNQILDTKSFINDIKPLVKNLMEKDYEFLLRIKYKEKQIDINKLFYNRIRDGILAIALGIFFCNAK